MKEDLKITKPERFNPKEWKDFIKHNCYLYAINCKSNREIEDVGEIAKIKTKPKYTDNELIERIFFDIQELGFSIRKSTYEEECNKNEWKIAVFSSKSKEYDYHFMREDSHNRWSHKYRGELPSNKDLGARTIMDPRLADIRTQNIEYRFVAFLIISSID